MNKSEIIAFAGELETCCRNAEKMLEDKEDLLSHCAKKLNSFMRKQLIDIYYSHDNKNEYAVIVYNGDMHRKINITGRTCSETLEAVCNALTDKNGGEK